MTTEKTYVLLDAMGIQDYIFQAGRLKVILGASLALADWQEQCRSFATNGDIISSAGGNVLASFQNKTDTSQFREECIKAAPPGMEIAWAETKAGHSEKDAAIWQRLQVDLARYKMGDRPADDYPKRRPPEAPGCDFCGIRPNDKKGKIKDSGTERSACAVCRRLFTTGSKLGKGKPGNTSMEKLLAIPAEITGDQNAGFPSSLESLVSYGDEAGDLLAVVVVDLNDLGNRIKEIVEKENFEKLRGFSTDLEIHLFAAIKTAMKGLWEDEDCRPLFTGRENEDAGKQEKDKKETREIFRIIPLMAAGDDMVFALPARLWQPFAVTLLKQMHPKGYPACAGIAIAKHSFPVNRLVLMAEELAANAKGYVRYLNNQKAADPKESSDSAPQYPGVALDWHVYQETAFSSVLEARKRHWFTKFKPGEYALGAARPYLLDDFLALTGEARRWRTTKAWSSRKLYTLREAVSNGPEQTRDTLTYVFLRDENDKLDKYGPLWERVENTKDNGYPLWEKAVIDGTDVWQTTMADLLELNEIRQGLKRRDEDG